MTTSLNIFTDGSSTGRVGPGGWAFVIIADQQELLNSFGYVGQTTNNRMELQAVIEALEYIINNNLNHNFISVFSDSQYVVKGINNWRDKWEVKIQQGKQILNQDLWIKIWSLVDLLENIDINWINGHSGIHWNEYVDKLAKSARINSINNNDSR